MAEWWRGVERVTERRSAATATAIAWRSRIPYELEFEFAVRETDAALLDGGDATGRSRARGTGACSSRQGVTAVLYEWNVRTTERWMNLLAPVARPIFEYNHDVVMRWGGEGLARRLDCNLLAAG